MNLIRKMEMDINDIQIGDQIKIPLKDFGIFTATAHQITKDSAIFMFDDCFTKRQVNSEASNKGGFEKSDLKKWLNQDLTRAFPENIRSQISDITLPSISQICGKKCCINTIDVKRAFEDDGDEPFPLMDDIRNRVGCLDKNLVWMWLRNVPKFADNSFAAFSRVDAVCMDFADSHNGIRPVFTLSF